VAGKIRKGSSTKQLLRTIKPRQVIVIRHRDVDDMAAAGMIDAKVKAVINAERSISGEYPVSGALSLLQSGIPVYEIEPAEFERFQDGMTVIIDESAGAQAEIRIRELPGLRIPAVRLTEDAWERAHRKAENNLERQLSDFIDNTLQYASREKRFVLDPLPIPPIGVRMAGRHVLVVVRGSGYKSDLLAIKDYIKDYKPVLIGLDGGADALMESGYTPDLIVGDMDSVSDRALQCGAEIIVHAYPDGRAPGMKRIEALGLEASKLPAPGTSEDVAMLIAYEKKAELIVTLGAHTHMIDFLQKGRKGMSSTMLVRMKIGSRLIDAKGVSKLYPRRTRLRNVLVVPAAACFPLLMLAMIHPGARRMMETIWLYLKLTLT
jgi:uncharacterized membrane-anchored protein